MMPARHQLVSLALLLLATLVLADPQRDAKGCWLGPPPQQSPNQQQQQVDAQQPQPVFVPTIAKTVGPSPSRDNSQRTTVFPDVQARPVQYPPPSRSQSGVRRPPPAVKGVQDDAYHLEQQTEDPNAVYFGPDGSATPRPRTPVYDRSGFRREPAHPSFRGSTTFAPTINGEQPTTPYSVDRYGLVTEGAVQRTPVKSPPRQKERAFQQEPNWNQGFQPRPRPQSRNQSRDATPPPQGFFDGPISTVFFDPTRRPKNRAPYTLSLDTTATVAATTSAPFFLPTTTNPSPSLIKEQTTPRPVRPSIGNRGSFDPAQKLRPELNSEIQTVPEYAFVKQPISTVLDKPDLELEGKPVSFAILKDALYRVNLLEVISGPGPISLFAPTDDAFLALPADVLIRLQNNPQFLRATLLRHIINFEVSPSSLRNNAILPSYSGEPLIINIALEGKLMLVRGTPILAATSAQNGVIYVINKVLVEGATSSNVLTEIERRPELSMFYSLLQRSSLVQKLQGQGPFTVLAPNNSAFEALSPVTRQVIEYNPSALERLLKSHVIEGAFYSKELESTPSLASSGKEPLKLRASPDGVISIDQGPSFTGADISTGNGVIHLTDGIVFPADLLLTFKQLEARTFFNRQPVLSGNSSPAARQQQGAGKPRFGFTRRQVSANSQQRTPINLGRERPEVARQQEPAIRAPDSSLSTGRFYRWLQKARFLDQINQSDANYTVILPNDVAVSKLPANYIQNLESNPRRLQALLMYHVIPGSVDISRLRDEDTLATVGGKEIRFNKYTSDQLNDSILTLSGAPVVGEKTENNGRVRFITVDRVLYPPQGSIFEVITRSPILKSLRNLVRIANLDTELSVSGPFTLFAPSDAAFNKLSTESLGYLSQDAESSRAFLLRHIVRPLIFTSSVPIGNTTSIENTAGERLMLNRQSDSVKVDGVGITYADITATNGVIHVVDHVL